MRDKKTDNNNKCHVRGTDYCDVLARGDCSVCPADKLSAEDREKLMDYVDAVRALMPEEGVQTLYESPTCLFCKDEPQEREWYADVDYAHIDPEMKLPGIFGTRTKSKVGSIVPLQIACCDRCRKNIKRRNFILPLCAGIGMAVGLVFGLVPPLRYMTAKVHAVMPLVVFLACSAIGFGIGAILRRRFGKRANEETVMDARELPYIKEMEEMGWFSLMDKGKTAKLVFSKERLKKGWFA